MIRVISEIRVWIPLFQISYIDNQGELLRYTVSVLILRLEELAGDSESLLTFAQLMEQLDTDSECTVAR